MRRSRLRGPGGGMGRPPRGGQRLGHPRRRRPHLGALLHHQGAEGGTGLGLSTVRAIVENHKGFITLKTRACPGNHVPRVPARGRGQEGGRQRRANPPHRDGGGGRAHSSRGRRRAHTGDDGGDPFAARLPRAHGIGRNGGRRGLRRPGQRGQPGHHGRSDAEPRRRGPCQRGAAAQPHRKGPGDERAVQRGPQRPDAALCERVPLQALQDRGAPSRRARAAAPGRRAA